MSQSSDLRSTTEHEYMKMFGDVVVGSYKADGSVMKKSAITLSGDELAKHKEMYATNAIYNKAVAVEPVVKKTKGKGKKKIEEPVAWIPQVAVVNEEPVQSLPVKKKFIYLHNKLGKIKMSVEAVLNSEMAFALVFSNEDDMIFVPNAAETLNFVDTHGDTHSVYYADTIFNWTDGIKRIMILFKSNE